MYQSLQAGRAIAAIFVVLFHLGGTIAKEKYFGIKEFNIPFLFGSAGVEFFFVLSGFIILTAHKNDLFKPEKFWPYIKKRAVRIYPIYWIVFFTICILANLSGTFSNNIPDDPWVILKALLLVPQSKAEVGEVGTLATDITSGSPVVAVAWTLQYEMFFYLFFSLFILNKWLAVFSGSILAYFLINYMIFEADSFSTWFLSQHYILLFLMGMMLSYISIIKKVQIKKTAPYLLGGVFIFLCVAIDTVCGFFWLRNQQTILYGISSSLIIFWLVQKENNNFIVGKGKWLQTLGDSSYSLYLIHNPLITVLCKIFLLMNFDRFGIIGAFVVYVFIFFACISSAVIFHLRVEVPVSRFLGKQFVSYKNLQKN